MSTSKSRKKKAPKRVLALPDLEHAKMAVLNSLMSASGQRTYDHAIRDFILILLNKYIIFYSVASGPIGTGRRRPKGDKRERTRAALLAAARDLIREKGYAQTTLEDIAERAGMTTGAIYGNFKNRDE